MKYIKPAFLFFANLFFLTLIVHSQKVKLLLNKGSRYETTTTSKSSSVSTIMGREMESNMENTTIQIIEVKDLRENETDLVSTISKITASTTLMGQEMNYDSDSKNNDGPMAEFLGKMVGKPKNITINAGGIVTYEEKSIDSASDQLSMMMGSGLTDNIPMIQASLVGKEIKIGYSWIDSVITNTEKIKTRIFGTYSVLKIENNIATIGFEGTQNISGNIEQMGQEMAMATSSKVTNQIQLNLTNGFIIENSYSVSGSGNIDAMGMSIPLTVNSTVINKIKML